MGELISTAITTYKREPAIVIRAVNSILKQTYKDIEIIVVDDSPSDYELREAVKNAVLSHNEEYPDIEIRYIPHEKNMGACVARNTAMEAAKGKYIAFLDDDDEWIPEKLEKQLRVMESSDAALVYCGCTILNDDTGRYYDGYVEYYRGRVFERLLFKNFIDSTSIPLIRLDCLKEIGGFDPLMQSSQDYDVWLRIARKYPVDCVQEPLVIYHEHSGERITNNPSKKIAGLERINSKNKEYIDADPVLWRQRHITITPYYAMKGDKQKALKVWRECCRKRPQEVVDNLKYLRRILFPAK